MSPVLARRALTASALSLALLAPAGAAHAAPAASVVAAPVTAAAPLPAPRPGPVVTTFTKAFAYGLTHPNLDPAGANDPTCRPTAAHPRPVVLLHGSYANRFNSFAALAPAIAKQGYCVFAPDYGQDHIPGINGAKAIRTSSTQIATYVDRVLAATGAGQVDLVGYSQGSLVARAYMKYDGGTNAADPSKNKVASLIGISGDNHGTTLAGLTGLVKLLRIAPLVQLVAGGSSIDQIAGSSFLTALNAGTETLPGVRYTMLATRTDEISWPYWKAYLTPSPVVHNVLLQRDCPLDLSDHFNITYSPRTTGFVLKALDPAYRGGTPCGFIAPLK